MRQGINKHDTGLYSRQGDTPIPLVGVHVAGDVTGRGASIRLAQRFRNMEAVPIEAVYKFPLPENATVCGFRVRMTDGSVTESGIEEREKAFELYDRALADGDGAWLLDQERPNIFTLSVGNLNPGDEVAVEIDFVGLLETHEREVRLFLPTTISPRYMPGDLPDHDGIPETDLVNPVFADSVPYGLSIGVRVQGRDGLEYLESPSHTVRQTNLDTAVHVEFTSETAAMDRDFVLNIKYREDIPCRAYGMRDARGSFLQVDFTPGEADSSAPARELVFLLDCSGSMEGSSIAGAKRALEVALRALGQGEYFNVYRFGSTFTRLFPRSMPYSAGTLAAALEWLAGVEADLGGTEILPALEDISRTAPQEGMQRCILLLTDGEVGNEGEILGLVAGRLRQTRIFTIGVGHGPNEYFIRQTARTSGGTAEMIAPGERIEPKTLRLFRKIASPCVSSLRVAAGAAGVQSPAVLTAFSGETSSLFLRTDAPDLPRTITVRGLTGEKEREWPVPVVMLDGAAGAIPVLWAREAIRDLEEDPGRNPAGGSRQRGRKAGLAREMVVGLSIDFGILSRFTSFVSVEKRPGERKCRDAAELRKVPVMLTKGWHGIDADVHESRAFPSAPSLKLSTGLAPAPHHAGYAACASVNDAVDCFQASACCAGLPCGGSVELPGEGEGSDPKMDLLLEILALQRAEGGFEMSAEVSGKLKLSMAAAVRVTDGRGTDLPAGGHVLLVTAVILELLEVHFRELEDIWRGVVGKSRGWLARELAGKELSAAGQPMERYVRELVGGLSIAW